MSTLQKGYFWGPKLPNPSPMKLLYRHYWGFLQPGYYDFATVPVGDNWALAKENAYTRVKLEKSCDVSLMPVFGYKEPSCGFLITKRGPYQSEETPLENRGAWEINSMPAGLVHGRVAIPAYAHSGARYNRYHTNGYYWTGNGWFPSLDSPFWNDEPPVGPKKLYSEDRVPVLPSDNGPDISILSAIENRPVYISITVVDMFGRESHPSTPLVVSTVPNTTGGSYIGFYRDFPVLMGTSGFHVYAGYSPTEMYRQPVINPIGSTKKYLWPVFMQHFVLHDVVNTGITPVAPPIWGIGSILNSPQKQVADGKRTIVYNEDTYDLYCPFILPYDPTNFGRIIGNHNRICTFRHKESYIDGRPLQSDIPMLYIQNQKDKMYDAIFISNHAIAGCTFSDFSGGQAFGDTIQSCKFFLYSEDSVGFLVDECCSMWYGNHTVSETRIKDCWFIATIPVKVEGNQTAKIRFTDMCSFSSTCITKYKGDTAIFYIGSPNDFDFTNLEGIGGEFRSIVTMVGYSGQPRVTVEEFFIDAGCPVYVTYSSYQGGIVKFLGGERINTHSQDWVRAIEAPHALNTNTKFDGIRMTPWASCIGFNLNQMHIHSDVPFAEIVTPDAELWTQKGLGLEYPGPGATNNTAYFDFRRKNILDYTFGYSDVEDSLPRVQVVANPNPNTDTE